MWRDPRAWLEERGVNLSRREATTVLLIGLLIAVVAVPVVGQLLSGGEPVSGTVALQTNSGATINVSGAGELELTTPFVDDNTVEIQTGQGNATFSSTGSVSADVDASNLTGEWTNVTGLSVTAADLQIDPEDKLAADVGGDADHFAFRGDMAVADEEADFTYGGASGTTTVTVRGVSPNINIVAVDKNGDTLGSGTSNDNGVVTISGMPNSHHVVTLDARTDPFVSAADPQGGEYHPNRAVDLNATVVDPQGDDFETVKIQTLSGGRWTTETTETSLPSGNEINASITAHPGENTWRVIMNATGGRDVVSDNFTFTTPGVITIYNGTANTLLAPDTVTGEVTSTTSNFKEGLTTSTGTADLNDISPPDEDFRSEWSASTFDNQTLLIHDPSVNRSVMLYETAASGTYTQCFQLNDNTGTFVPSDSWVVVEEYVDGEWRTAASQYFGVGNEAEVVLEDGETYRVMLRNDQGGLRVLGSHTADSSDGCVILTVESSIDPPEAPETVAWNATCTDTSPKRVKFEYNDSLQTTDTIHYTIYEYQNESNALLPNTSFSGDFGVFSYTANVPMAQNDTTWVVDVVAVREGDNVVIQDVVCGRQNVLPGAAPWVITFLFVGIIWITAGLFSQLNGALGGLVVAGMGGMFWMAGFAPPMLGAGVVALSMITAGILFVRERRGGL